MSVATRHALPKLTAGRGGLKRPLLVNEVPLPLV